MFEIENKKKVEQLVKFMCGELNRVIDEYDIDERKLYYNEKQINELSEVFEVGNTEDELLFEEAIAGANSINWAIKYFKAKKGIYDPLTKKEREDAEVLLLSDLS
ncbi:hypothetical protein [Tenuibacillus multivorans]|uniref:Uncharacterized protein n=1 Tax=Tenuibacillus multivorans TaxID=237069 RepID=A0A1G9XRL3_9BACI|nr:hypothetical protein [Tenuibacillus multivorans]GEL75787.1 hypothetical protein TMU01_00220 [Tenuibacillus multivorans]SDM99360.1 hypothetical protein SAMN05216498_1079 [Tenuibacillus multivorans]